MNDLYFLVEITALFFVSYLFSILVRELLIKKQWLDLPNERSSHQNPVPKSGGLGFVTVFSFWLIILAVLSEGASDFNQWSLFVVAGAGLLLGVMGFVDDAVSLGITCRLSVQALGAVLLLLVLPVPQAGLYGVEFLSTQVVTISVFVFLIWFVNLYNFMDGIDGLATLQGIFFCCSLSLVSFQHSPVGFDIRLMLGLSACLCGFLLLNLSPAKIFMGDVGSNFLGFMIPALALLNMTISGSSPWTCLTLMSVFLVDSFFTLMVRVAQKQVWYHAHRSHAYQRLVSYYERERRAFLEEREPEQMISEERVRSFSHKRAVLVIMCINLFWVAPIAYLAEVNRGAGALLFCLCCLPLLVAANALRAGRVAHG